MLGWRSRRMRPPPSARGAPRTWSGETAKTSRLTKNAPKPRSTALAYGVTSRMRLRVRKSTRLDHIASSHAHSSSEPSCEDHTAAPLYKPGVVVDECEATVANEKSERRKASSRTPKEI